MSRVDSKSHAPEQVETLRDRFAMAALTGMLAKNDMLNGMANADYARVAYGLADAMMEARK